MILVHIVRVEVEAQCAGKEDRILHDQRDARPKIIQIDRFGIDSINQDRASSWNQSQQCKRGCRFSGSFDKDFSDRCSINIQSNYIPVRPTMPIFAPDEIVTEISSRTVGPSSEYFADRCLSTISPLVGHAAGGSPFAVCVGSCSIVQ